MTKSDIEKILTKLNKDLDNAKAKKKEYQETFDLYDEIKRQLKNAKTINENLYDLSGNVFSTLCATVVVNKNETFDDEKLNIQLNNLNSIDSKIDAMIEICNEVCQEKDQLINGYGGSVSAIKKLEDEINKYNKMLANGEYTSSKSSSNNNASNNNNNNASNNNNTYKNNNNSKNNSDDEDDTYINKKHGVEYSSEE